MGGSLGLTDLLAEFQAWERPCLKKSGWYPRLFPGLHLCLHTEAPMCTYDLYADTLISLTWRIRKDST